MYQAQSALFLYCISPVHMGAGTAVGLIDNPIQRERHTEHPLFAGSGLKGAVRHRAWTALNGASRDGKTSLLDRLFGPDAGSADLHAGAVSFGDAQLVAFPVRCTRRAYTYATSPTALARAKRTLNLLGIEVPWKIPEVKEGFCRIVSAGAPADEGKPLHLESFEHVAIAASEMDGIAEWLSEHALPSDDAYAFFRDKLKHDLVLLPDEDFGYYVRNATVVEPHVRIDNETGTAQEGGLFYTENLPPESLLIAPLMASIERSGKGAMSAEDVLKTVLEGGEGIPGLDGQVLQVGGDATTGRGQVVVAAVS
jgi:CRISPR-associated protein Cmr4